MKPGFHSSPSPAAPSAPGADLPDAAGPLETSHPGAVSAERLHWLLKRIRPEEWLGLKSALLPRLAPADRESGIAALEQLFRHGEPVAPPLARLVLTTIETLLRDHELADTLRQAFEKTRARVRFVLREMSDADWEAFRHQLQSDPHPSIRAEEFDVLELVFRIGESISNVETAALALAEQQSPHKQVDPEVARRNAMVRVPRPGQARPDPETAYREAQHASLRAAAIARRADNTLASDYVLPTMAYRHARSTLFRAVDAILAHDEWFASIARLEQELLAIEPVSREKIRWVLHRSPIPDRLALLRLIPLNTVLMFLDEAPHTARADLLARATRDRRLAYDLFVGGLSDEELARRYGISVNAVKNAVGVALEALQNRPQARRLVRDYLARVADIPPMDLDEARRALKRLAPPQRAALVNGIPHCAWKVREVIQLHKRLFLDYSSGEWVLKALVDYYNLEGPERLQGVFRREGALTVRGAHAAIAGILQKLTEEPSLRDRLRRWAAASPVNLPAETPPGDSEESGWAALLPSPLKPRPHALPTDGTPDPDSHSTTAIRDGNEFHR